MSNQIAIRVAGSIRSNPECPPVDQLTGKVPAFFRGSQLTVDFALFDASGYCVDLSNLDQLEFDLLPWPIEDTDPNTNLSYAAFSNLPFPSVPPAPLLFQTLTAEEIVGMITREGWIDGTAQQGRVSFSWADTASLNLGGESQKPFILTIRGRTSLGAQLVYVVTPIIVYESGTREIYLPNDVPPLTVPEGTIFYVEANTQLLFSETIEVDGGQIQQEGLMVQVE